MKILPVVAVAFTAVTLSACLEPPTPTWYVDADSDGYGDENDAGTLTTVGPEGYVTNNRDCNDADGDINPAAYEATGDNIDNNCDGNIDTFIVGQRGEAGGIVFYVDNGGATGLEAETSDLNSGGSFTWDCLVTQTDATGTAIGTGATNTQMIIDAMCTPVSGTNPMAAAVDAYSKNGFADWFIPSQDELVELYEQRSLVGGFVNANYGTSTEVAADQTVLQNLSTGTTTSIGKNTTFRIRAIRAFD